MSGYIRLYRSLFANPIWTSNEPFDLRSAFIDLVQRAAFVPTFAVRNGKTVKVDVGELVASERELAERWNMSRTQVRRHLGILRALGSVETREVKEANATIYKLPNYAELNGICASGATTEQTASQPPNEPRPPRHIQNKINNKNISPLYPPKAPETPPKKGENGANPADFALKNGGNGSPIRRVYEGQRAGVGALPAPTYDEWNSYAAAIGWAYPEEYRSSWQYFEMTKDDRGYWRDKEHRVIANWRMLCESLVDYWAKRNGRKRHNYRPIEDCLRECAASGIEPLHWRDEYAAQFKLQSVETVGEYYETFGALLAANRSLAALIMARCIKHHREDRAQFDTQYVAELKAEEDETLAMFRCAECGYSFGGARSLGKGKCPKCGAEHSLEVVE